MKPLALDNPSFGLRVGGMRLHVPPVGEVVRVGVDIAPLFRTDLPVEELRIVDRRYRQSGRVLRAGDLPYEPVDYQHGDDDAHAKEAQDRLRGAA